MYTVYLIVNNHGIIHEDIAIKTEDLEEAKEIARSFANSDKLEKHPENHSVEIRTNEDFEKGTCEVIEF